MKSEYNKWVNLDNGKPLNDTDIMVYSQYTDKYYIEYVDSEFWIRVRKLQYTHYKILQKINFVN